MKKLTSIILSVVVLLSLMTGFGITAQASLSSGICGNNVRYSFNEQTGTLTISGNGDMADYLYDNSPFANNQEIESIVINSGVTSVGDSAFVACDSLTNVKLPNSITRIGDSAFSLCDSLSAVTIPNSVKSIGNYAFEGCFAITNISIPNSVISIGSSAFYECTKLLNITIPYSVTSIGKYSFSGCKNLTDIYVSSQNTAYSSLNGILFNKNQSELICCPMGNDRTEYYIPDTVVSIGDSAFVDCKNIKIIIITNNVTNIGKSAFVDCLNLTDVIIPDSVSFIGSYAFGDCVSLKNLVIPNGVACIEESTFSACYSLESITIPNTIKNIADFAFSYCEDLADVYFLGTKAEWKNIIIGSNNNCLADATIHCTGGVINDDSDISIGDNDGDYILPIPSQPDASAAVITPPQTLPTVPTKNNVSSTSVKKPKSTKIKTAKGSKKGIAVVWSKVSGVNGYEVQVSSDKKFKKDKKTAIIKKQKTTKTTIKKLKVKKKYYVRVRTYKTLNGKRVYSSWSKVKTAKTK